MTTRVLSIVLVSALASHLHAESHRNVLFIASDDLNNDLGCYGHPLVRSPHIDRLARRGIRFDRAYCQYPVCNPSRASFMTGLYPHQTGVLSNGGDFRKKHPRVETLPQLFRRNGYFVARVGKIYHYGVPGQIGTSGKDDDASWDEVVNPRGRDRDDEEKIHSIARHRNFGGTLSWLAADGKDEEQTDAIGALAAIELMEKHHPDKTRKPFFLAVGFYRPHTPYVAPKSYFELYPRDRIRPVKEVPGDRDDIPPAALADRAGQRELSDARRREIIQAYYASVTFMDAQVGRLLDALERLELRDSTLIVFVSDHGYHLGRHGLWQKSDLFEDSVRVPLVISDPARPKTAGRASNALTELVDLYPTIAELCGLKTRDHLQGRSLVPVLDDPSASVRSGAFSVSRSRGKWKGRPKGTIIGYTLRTDHYRYTEWGETGQHGVELYDHRSDPHEYRNLARQTTPPPALEKLRQALAARRAATR